MFPILNPPPEFSVAGCLEISRLVWVLLREMEPVGYGNTYIRPYTHTHTHTGICVYIYIYRERERERERERIDCKKLAVQLGRLRSPLICYLLAGDPQKPVV